MNWLNGRSLILLFVLLYSFFFLIRLNLHTTVSFHSLIGLPRFWLSYLFITLKKFNTLTHPFRSPLVLVFVPLNSFSFWLRWAVTSLFLSIPLLTFLDYLHFQAFLLFITFETLVHWLHWHIPSIFFLSHLFVSLIIFFILIMLSLSITIYYNPFSGLPRSLLCFASCIFINLEKLSELR